MSDLAPLTTSHEVGTREFTAAVWYALRSAYSARHRPTSSSHMTRTTRSDYRDRVRAGKQIATRAYDQVAKSSSRTSSSTHTIKASRNTVSESSLLRGLTTPSPSLEPEAPNTDTTSDDYFALSPSLSDHDLSDSFENSHIDPRLLDQTQDSSSNVSRIDLEPLIERKDMKVHLSKARHVAGLYDAEETTRDHSIDDLVDGFTYR